MSRFARRRGNQADALVEAVATHTVALVVPGRPAGLVAGGDRALVRQLLDHPRLRSLADLPRRELYDLPDPKREVLDRALERGRAVRIRLTEAATPDRTQMFPRFSAPPPKNGETSESGREEPGNI